MLTRFVILMGLVCAAPAQAARVCQQVDVQKVQCLTDEYLLEVLAEFDQQYPRAAIQSAGVMAAVREARERAGTDTLIVDQQNRFRAGLVGESLGNGTYELLDLQGIITRPPPIAPPGILEIPRPPWQRISLSASNDIHEDGGVNTDGQMLHGPPGSAATWGCTGYGSTDTCKACCMATRSLGLAPIVAYAKLCHGAIANACMVAAWICHAGCAATEAIMLGALWYSADKCNDNCEHRFWNDTSVDWHGAQHNSLRQSLETGRYAVCEGWVGTLEWGGLTWITLSHDYWDRAGTYECLMHLTGENDVTEELYWGAVNRKVRVAGTWQWDMKPIEFRVVDVDPTKPGRQIPYVGVTGIDDTGLYITVARTGKKLYLDNVPVLESMKVWAHGSIKNDHMDVRRGDWGVLWLWWLEGVI